MWWILCALLSLIAWAIWFILDLEMWIPIAATGFFFVLAVFLFIFKRIRAKRAARALEEAIAGQGAQQALNARPERRAEIQELQKQVSGGISALKQSKLGSGKKGGASALYSLPWYAIIGPPGAGKTTALKHSGLVFPYADAGGGGVRGVGGTRNCDWWFTNEAILLDTAGRYTTESDDHDEWIAFLQMLLKYRSRQPMNGILVAISITDLIDASEQQIEEMGKKIRARIDEVMTQLHMVMPVYVLFTKCDLIAGFSEFFGDLRKSDRAQGWGTTLRLDMAKPEPGKIFDAEFDILVKQIHARALKRLAMERSREAREKIFQFPLELAGIKRNLSELVATIFMVNAFQGTPIFRGFYFTSGTQEGKPLDRVLGRMGQAMGIRVSDGAAAAPPQVESKSYFLYDVFMKVVFPDGSIAARSKGEIRRQAIMRLAISAAALALAVIVAIPGVVSYLNNSELLTETQARAKAASEVVWNDGRPVTEKIKLLDPVLERLKDLDNYREEGVPFSKSWMMYRGEELYRPTVAVYVSSLQQGFVVPCKQKLELSLRGVKGESYLQERLTLKTYLMLNDIEHLDIDWATGQLTALWAEMQRSTSSVSDYDLKKQMVEHVRYYLTLLKDKRVTPLEPDAALIEKARKTLQGVPVSKRYYDLFVNVLVDEKYDDAGDNTRENRLYPAFTLGEMFLDRPEVLKVITSALYEKEKRYKEVEGPYTEKGHYAVLVNVQEGAGLLEREQWVVPLTNEEKGDRIPVNLKRLAEDYESRYIIAWTEWMADIQVKSPATIKEAIDFYGVLTKADWPYLRILRAVEDNTLWKRAGSALDNKSVNDRLNREAERKFAQKTQGLRIKVDVQKIGERASTVPAAFRSTVEFGVPPDTKAGGATAPIVDTSLAKYVSILEKTRSDMIALLDKNPNVDARVMAISLQDAAKQSNTLLQPFDDKARTLIGPLLQDPLKVGGMKFYISRLP